MNISNCLVPCLGNTECLVCEIPILVPLTLCFVYQTDLFESHENQWYQNEQKVVAICGNSLGTWPAKRGENVNKNRTKPSRTCAKALWNRSKLRRKGCLDLNKNTFTIVVGGRSSDMYEHGFRDMCAQRLVGSSANYTVRGKKSASNYWWMYALCLMNGGTSHLIQSSWILD